MKYILISLLICLGFNGVQSQSVAGDIYQNPNRDESGMYAPPVQAMYELDGLLLSPEKMLNLNIHSRSIENVKINKGFRHRVGDHLYEGKVQVATNLVVILDGDRLNKGKEKYKRLSQLNEKQIKSMTLLDLNASREKYGTKDLEQVLIINTKE
ncbi:hypothetical protein LJB95_02720 [Paludibacteraceae bacterium OttesenSCG-928-F17]|nr:hypothetical protein [Paludibacteraceae bacterium OttesenSCG-928-F17]